MSDSTMDSPVIVALDYDNAAAALGMVDALDPGLCKVKVGKELFTRCGPALVTQLVDKGFDVFLDLKFHDIPNTTARAVAAAADLGVWMVNVHASGGSRMMAAAAAQLAGMGGDTRLIAVTVLTSMGAFDLAEIGISASPASHVANLATLARSCGLDGVVCSAHEASRVRSVCGDDFLRVTPGIRPASSGSDDQVRIMTPSRALAAGSTHLVIGRPITGNANPRQSLLDILAEIDEA